ncbi:hypothetical protein AVEN_264381-1 [Araneus ventricosus]|uniref:Uncharacterized protein n=1 Tax=Araneus ventricosus TaxID=182803 RepID=A0A4Y2H681_ARAVE|nr:hypothetical protein AVEN_264381-1 [Araneus ventricosus]
MRSRKQTERRQLLMESSLACRRGMEGIRSKAEGIEEGKLERSKDPWEPREWDTRTHLKKNWDTDSYPHILYCAIESDKLRNETSIGNFINKRTNQISTATLKKSLRTQLEAAGGPVELTAQEREQFGRKGLTPHKEQANQQMLLQALQDVGHVIYLSGVQFDEKKH